MALNDTGSSTYTGAVAPSYNGGYVPGQVESVGGGYDPNNPSYGNQANSIGGNPAISEAYVDAPSFAPGIGGYEPGQEISQGGGYDPNDAGSVSDFIDNRPGTKINADGSSGSASDPTVVFQSQSSSNQNAGTTAEDDWRVRISLADGAKFFYKDSNSNPVMKPLLNTNGVIFPYTPQITISHAANYTPAAPAHSNYPIQFYNNSEVSDITIAGDFTVQSIEEGQYLMAVVYFFRSATKMFFGSGKDVGNPPPIVFLDGYGAHYFPHVPCVISNFQHTMGNDTDYILTPITATTLEETQIQPDANNFGSVNDSLGERYIPEFGSKKAVNNTTYAYKSITTNTRVPAVSTISITLKPVYSRKNLHDRFDLNKFAAGGLLSDPTGGFGGFL